MSPETKATFTPGPWKAFKQPKSGWYVGAYDSQLDQRAIRYATTLWRIAAGRPQHNNTDEGNACLIAAAPDLYEALKALTRAINPRIGNETIEPYFTEPMQRARAAIAKAEGQR